MQTDSLDPVSNFCL